MTARKWMKHVRSKATDIDYKRAHAITGGTVRVFSFFDVHISVPDEYGEVHHDEVALTNALACLAEEKPEIVVIGGDFLELASCSSHGGQARVPLLIDELAVGLAWLERFRDAAPQAEMVYLMGNHETRAMRKLVKDAGVLWGLLDLPEELHLEKLGISWRPYGQLWAPSLEVQSPIVYTHGAWHPKHHAAKAVEMYSRTIRYGHTHRPQTFVVGTPDNGYAMGIGSPCLRTIQPGFRRTPTGHAQGFGVDTICTKTAALHVEQVLMKGRRFLYNGTVWG